MTSITHAAQSPCPILPPSAVSDAVLAVSNAALLPVCLAWTQSHSSFCDEQVIMTAQLGAASAKSLG